MTTVTWVQDSNGNYEISSAEHLKQLMNEGSLYTDAGTPPSRYWGSSGNFTSYIQTVDIDLLNDSTDIKPIGTSSTRFYGNYDGSEYSISNYSYVDPNFNTFNACENYIGLFGFVIGGSYLKNIRLDGVWTIQGFNSHAGFLVAYYPNGTGTISNIEGNFSTGTLIDTNSATTSVLMGTIGGDVRPLHLLNITVKGTVDYQLPQLAQNMTVGGIVGYLSPSGDIDMIRNLATYPSGIFGWKVGGICGEMFFSSTATSPSQVSNVLNAMIGDVHSNLLVGGIFGNTDSFNFTSVIIFSEIVNSMTGDIYATTSDAMIGGIAGKILSTGTSEKLLNYMTGNIYLTGGNTSTTVGGLLGNIYLERDVNVGSVQNSINAMNGSVDGDGLFGIFQTASPTSVNNITNTNFGLTFTTNAYNNGTPTGLVTNSEFMDLPYFDLIGTDENGNSIEYEFAYGNLAGNASYPDYTHLVIHRRNIDTPYEVSYGLNETNTTVYLTYVNVNTQTVYPPSGLTGSTTVTGVTFFLPPPAFTVEERAINLKVTIVEVPGSTGYMLTTEGPTGGEVTRVRNTLELSHNIVGLGPEMQYTIRLYVDTGSGYTHTESITVTTLANIASNYDLTDFEEDGKANLISLKSNLDFGTVIDDLFTTGDVVSTPVSSNSDVQSVFVNRGDILNILGVESTLLPFYETSGSGQTVTLRLSDNSTNVPITYDESTDSITVDSVTYTNGSSFILDGRKAKVYEY